ncbi:hypothetical protein D3C85_1052410 [compost metagenome]
MSTKRLGSSRPSTVFSSWAGWASAQALRAAGISSSGSRLMWIFSPASQKEEICRMAGPERPRWVNSMASLKRVPSSAVTATGRLTPARSAKASFCS